MADVGSSACSALLDAKEIRRRRLRPLEIDCLSLDELAESRCKLEKDLFDAEFGNSVDLSPPFDGSETSVISEVVGSEAIIPSRFLEEIKPSSLSLRKMGLTRPSTGISSIYSRPRLSWEYWKICQRR